MNGLLVTRKFLEAQTSVMALIEHVFVGEAPQNFSRSYISIWRVSENDDKLLTGAAQFPETRIQFDCIAEDVGLAEDLRTAVIQSLQDITCQRMTIGGVQVEASFTRVGGADGNDGGANTGLYRAWVDFIVSWRIVST
jgi:hypothetical protein